MIARALLLVLLCSAAHCVPSTKTCTSTLSGQTDITPYCKSVTYNSEMADSCTVSEVKGWSEHYYTLGDADMKKCMTVVLRVEETAGLQETYVYRGPLVGEIGQAVKTCEQYCSSLREAHQWLLENWNVKVTPLYVSCMDTLNNEDLTAIAAAGAGPSAYTCAADNGYAGSTATYPPATNEPNAPGPQPTVTPTIVKKDGEGSSMPGWYFVSLAVQVVSLVASLILCIYGIVLYSGFKSTVYPNDMEMK